MFGNLPMQIRMACPYLLLVNVGIWTSLIEESIKSLSKISSSFFSLSLERVLLFNSDDIAI